MFGYICVCCGCVFVYKCECLCVFWACMNDCVCVFVFVVAVLFVSLVMSWNDWVFACV